MMAISEIPSKRVIEFLDQLHCCRGRRSRYKVVGAGELRSRCGACGPSQVYNMTSQATNSFSVRFWNERSWRLQERVASSALPLCPPHFSFLLPRSPSYSLRTRKNYPPAIFVLSPRSSSTRRQKSALSSSHLSRLHLTHRQDNAFPRSNPRDEWVSQGRGKYPFFSHCSLVVLVFSAEEC